MADSKHTTDSGHVAIVLHPTNENPPTNGGQTAETPQPKYRVTGSFRRPQKITQINGDDTILVHYDRSRYYLSASDYHFDIEVECDLLSVYQTAKRIISERENVPLNCVAIGSVKAVSNE